MSSVAHNSNSRPLRKLTFEEFLDWCDSDTRAEWVNGRTVILSPENKTHIELVFFLVQVLGPFVRRNQLGRIYGSGLLMKLPATQSARMPDLLFVSKSREANVEETYLDGPADLAVEIVSPDSADRDTSEKFVEYQAAGVREYWIIDPKRETADFYELGSDRRYYPVPLCDGAFRSTVIPGFWLKPKWLWEEPLPDPLDLLRELGVISSPAEN
jgi:Uma2 family endonuclease